MYPVHYVVEGDTLPVLFHTFDSNDPSASVTLTGLAVTDIEIYKDGSVTQRASDSGYALLDTDGIDFDGITGIHGFSIDLSDDTASGFFEVGPWYHVVVSSVTVDAATVNFIACAFRIVSATRGMAGTALPAAAADAAGGLPISDAGGLDLDTVGSNVAAILDDTDLIDDGTSGLAKIATDVAAVLVDTADMQPKVGTAADLGSGATLFANLTDVASLAAAILADLSHGLPIRIANGSIGSTGNDTTHLHLTGLGYGDDEINGHLIYVYDDSADLWYSAWITDWANSGDLATVTTLPFTPEDGTDSYVVTGIKKDPDVAAVLVDTAEIGTAGAGLTEAGGTGDQLTALATASALSTHDGKLDTVDGIVDAILVDTSTTLDNLVDDLESRLGTPSDLGSGATIAANLADIEGQTDDIGVAGAGLSAVPWNATWDAEVQSEVNDGLVAFFTSKASLVTAIWAEAMTEIGSVPGVTASFGEAVRWLFALARNKVTQTSTTQTLRNDADSGDIATSTVSDDGTTATRGEWS